MFFRGSSKSEVIIDVNVVEKPTGSLTFGAGYSSATGLGGLSNMVRRNFLGRGTKPYHLQSKLVKMINFMNYLFMNQCLCVMILDLE